jgi:hypothetical protein
MRFTCAGAARRRVRQWPAAILPKVEQLEDRWLPSFSAGLSFDTGTVPSAVAVGDFTGDGLPDLAVANRDSDTVSVLLSKGDGTFQPARDFPAGEDGFPSEVAVGDFNGDGILDLALTVI